MAETARLGALLIVHAEDASVIDDSLRRPEASSMQHFLRSRPHAAENPGDRPGASTRRRRTGGRAHVLHSRQRRRPAAAARRPGRRCRPDGRDLPALPGCRTPSTSLTARPSSSAVPPIRDARQPGRCWAGLGAGDIDLVVSDHSPCTAELKRRDTGDFGQAWGGIASVQVGLPVVWTAARARGHDLARRRAVDGPSPGRPGGLPTRAGSRSARTRT